MTLEIILLFLVLLASVVFFALELFPVDKIAFFVIVSLTLCNLITPEEAISGFSNRATITVLLLMIIAIAMEQNGVINWLVSGLAKIKSFPFYLMVPIFMIVTAGISAFISTTAVVIVFIKIISQLSEKYQISQSKLLLPVSFAGILGGACTLMGTSTNLIVNSVAQNLGASKLGFFEFSLFGLIFLAVAIIYITLTLRWLPHRKHQKLNDDDQVHNFITTVKINEGSRLIGRTIKQTFLYNNPDIYLLKLTRDGKVNNAPGKYITLKTDDELMIMCTIKSLSRINKSDHLTIHNKKPVKNPWEAEEKAQDPEVKSKERIFVELLMLPRAPFLGKTLGELEDFILKDAVPVAIKKRKRLRNIRERLLRRNKNKISLKPGDRLLVEIDKEQVQELNRIENVVVLQEFQDELKVSPSKKYFSLFVLLSVILMAATGVFSILVSALTGVFLLLFTNSLNLNNVYKKIDWQIIFLLAGMIPLGIAMHNTGADVWLSKQLLALMHGQPVVVIIGGIFLITMLMSGIVSNNATAIIMLPIAIGVAQSMKMELKPFILAVMFAANFSFFTPVGYQTNTLVYGMGIYKFSHFLRIGGVLSLILWILATFLLKTLL